MNARYVFLDNPLPQHLYDALLQRIPKEKQDRISRFQAESERQIRLLADLLVRVFAAETLGLENREIEIAVAPAGKPFLLGHPAFQYSVSHTKGAALAAFDSHPVGADLEALRKVHPAVVRRYFSASEQAYAAPNGVLLPDRMLEIWTAKEAYAKLLGTGLPRVFSQADTMRADFPYNLHRYCHDAYRMTVCAEKGTACLFEQIPLPALLKKAMQLSPYEGGSL